MKKCSSCPFWHANAHIIFGYIGTLMANTGLSDLLKFALGGVDKMFLGKEILIHILLEKSLTDFEILMNYLHIKRDQSRIACL